VENFVVCRKRITKAMCTRNKYKQEMVFRVQYDYDERVREREWQQQNISHTEIF
jgi:hypothetical protein